METIKNKSNKVGKGLFWTSIGVVVVCGSISMICIVDGVSDYPTLCGKLAEARAYKVHLADMKTAVYAYKEDGKVVAGSIENFKQSSNLSVYIEKLVKMESSYMKLLSTSRACKRSIPIWIMGSGFFTSEKVFSLPDTP